MLSRTALICLGVSLGVGAAGLAQNAQPAVAGAAQSANRPGAVMGSQTPVTTLKADAQLVVVDVVVTDNKQRAVHGLKASDFKLTENGVPQMVKSFEEHTAATLEDATRFAPMRKLPAGVFTNRTPAAANGVVNLLLLDELNTPLEDQAYMRKQLLEYVRSAPAGTRIAIFGLTTHLILLQGFTSDPEVLRRVLEKDVGKVSPAMNDGVGGGGTHNDLADEIEDMELPGTAVTVAAMRQFEAQEQTSQLQLRAKYTLDAMNQIARYLAGITGRKNLIWFSGSFPLDVLPNTDDIPAGALQTPRRFAAVDDWADEYRETTTLLEHSQVAVYPIDVRGLTSSPIFTASTDRNYADPNTGRTRLNHDQTLYTTDTVAEHSTMTDMAEATGGKAFVDTNGLTEAVRKAVEEGSNFYTLSYTPSNGARDGKLRKIKAEVDRRGVNLAYRKGYYAEDPEKIKPVIQPDEAETGAEAATARETFRLAMTLGAPTPTEIRIKVGVVPITPRNETEDAPAKANRPSAKMQGPYRRYSVNYAIEPGDLVFVRAGDGTIHSDFSLIIFVSNPEGDVENSLIDTIHFAGTMDDVKKMFAYGLISHEEVSAPAKGEHFLRIAVRDLRRDRYGAVEVATSEVGNVVPYADGEAAAHAGAAK